MIRKQPMGRESSLGALQAYVSGVDFESPFRQSEPSCWKSLLLDRGVQFQRLCKEFHDLLVQYTVS